MAVHIAPPPRQQYLNANGDPYVGGKLFTYAAGSSSKLPTYTTSTGLTQNTNPIILDAAGRTPYGVWLSPSLTYKFVLALSTDTDPPTSPVFTEDVVEGVNDTNTSASQWIASGYTPTYVSTTQFTVAGDQTAALHVGRRVKVNVTAGTRYGGITVSAYTTLTTITVLLDSGTLDSGLSTFDVGVLTAVNTSMPAQTGNQPLDPTLTALAGLDATAGLVEQTGADAFIRRPISANIKSFLGAADNAAARTALGADNAANLTTGNVAAARITTALNASGTAPIYACRAWVSFNGTGAVAPQAHGNVSSVTDNGVGDYTVNFITPMQDALYCANVTCSQGAAAGLVTALGQTGPNLNSNNFSAANILAGSVKFVTGNASTSAAADPNVVHVAVFR